jgi:hypothetical protein
MPASSGGTTPRTKVEPARAAAPAALERLHFASRVRVPGHDPLFDVDCDQAFDVAQERRLVHGDWRDCCHRRATDAGSRAHVGLPVPWSGPPRASECCRCVSRCVPSARPDHRRSTAIPAKIDAILPYGPAGPPH